MCIFLDFFYSFGDFVYFIFYFVNYSFIYFAQDPCCINCMYVKTAAVNERKIKTECGNS